MEGILLLLVIQAFVFGFFCSYIAKEKGRSSGSWFFLGLCFSILAVLALIAVPKIDDKKSSVTPLPGTRSDGTLQEKEFDGERNISSPAYQLFLTRRFGIEKNATLEKFVIGDEVFNTLEASLREADCRYGHRLSETEVATREAREIERKLAFNFLSSLTDADTLYLEKLSKQSVEDRKKSCSLCSGGNPKCVLCKKQEQEVSEYQTAISATLGLARH